MDRFYCLPGHILALIYQFDPTFHEFYKQSIFELSKNHRIYYPSGVSLFLNYKKSKDGKKDGHYFEYYPKHVLKMSCVYKNNKLNGPVVEYYPNGHIFRKYQCYSDRLSGIYLEYYDNGNLMTRSFYNEYEQQDGPCFQYYANGNLLKQCFFIQGIISGVYILYKENGNIYKKVVYKKNKT
jgi:antitoxin component YwqK of YwqJK toxin-antitoxin module